MAALHMDSSNAKTYLCTQGGTASLFLSRPTCHILNLADKHGSSLIQAYIPTHLNVGAAYLLQRGLVSEWHLLPNIAQTAFHLWDQPEKDLLAFSCNNISCIAPSNSNSSGRLGVECFQQPLDITGELCVSSSCISCPGYVQVSGITC